MPREVDSQCSAFQSAVTLLGRPWTALILNALQAGPLRFNELAERARGPGDKILSARLKELEQRNVVVRTVDRGPPVRVHYELTDCGRAFGELASAIERWGRTLVVAEARHEAPRGRSPARPRGGRGRARAAGPGRRSS